MKSLFNMALTAVIAITLVGCKTVLPSPTGSNSTLVLAPFAADTSSKTSSAWMYEYVLNNDIEQTIRFNPERIRGSFSVVTNLAEGEYKVTGLKSVAHNKGRTRAIGEGQHYQFDKDEYVSFTVKAGDITLIPAIFTMTKEKRNREYYYIRPHYAPLNMEELQEFKTKVEQLEGYDNWAN
ncbi:hypothetical protein [Marinomonas sp. PE14-40]|uniref:hypothetical protein n=1 Tax=Marinomonas sp. PE14-40 TaxID=3060621 RepID=UPI003F6786D4